MSGDERRGADALFELHRPGLVRYLARLTGDVDLADDIAQESFVRLLEQPAAPDRPRAWLFRVATNLVRDRGRAVRRRHLLATAERARFAHGDPPAPPDAAVGRDGDQCLVRAALDALSEKERTALLMREEGFMHREIADTLGTTTGSVGTLLRRAIHKAAARLASEEA